MKARAAGVMVNLETGDVKLVDLVEDDGTGLDPIHKVRALWESVEGDWPGYQLCVAANDEAGELQKQRRMWGLGMSDEGDEMPARIAKHNEEVEARRNAPA